MKSVLKKGGGGAGGGVAGAADASARKVPRKISFAPGAGQADGIEESEEEEDAPEAIEVGALGAMRWEEQGKGRGGDTCTRHGMHARGGASGLVGRCQHLPCMLGAGAQRLHLDHPKRRARRRRSGQARCVRCRAAAVAAAGPARRHPAAAAGAAAAHRSPWAQPRRT